MRQILDLEDMKIGIQRGHDGSLIVMCDVNYKKVIEKENHSGDWIHFYGQVLGLIEANRLVDDLRQIPTKADVGLAPADGSDKVTE